MIYNLDIERKVRFNFRLQEEDNIVNTVKYTVLQSLLLAYPVRARARIRI